MHSIISFLAASGPTTTVKGSKSGGGSQYAFLVIIALFALIYLFFIRPRSQRMRQAQSAGRQLAVGDAVMSAGGIYGTVVALDSDVVEVEVSPGIVLNFTRRAISPRPGATPAAPVGGSATGGIPVDDEWDTPPAIEEPAPPEEPAASEHPPGDDPSGHQPDTPA